MKKISLILVFIFAAIGYLNAQNSNEPVKWRCIVRMTSPTEGSVTLRAIIDDTWHIYGTKAVSNGPVPTSFNFDGSEGIVFTDDFKPSTPAVEKTDASFGIKIGMWNGNVTFVRHFRLKGNVKDAVIKGSVRYMCCNDKNCMPPKTQNFNTAVKPYVAPTK